MYVKVHMKNNHWYRIDDQVHYGKNVEKNTYDYTYFKSKFGDHFFAILNENGKNLITTIYHGYFDKYGHFFHFCHSKKCLLCQKRFRILFCPKYTDVYKVKTGGYYINIPD